MTPVSEQIAINFHKTSGLSNTQDAECWHSPIQIRWKNKFQRLMFENVSKLKTVSSNELVTVFDGRKRLQNILEYSIKHTMHGEEKWECETLEPYQ